MNFFSSPMMLTATLTAAAVALLAALIKSLLPNDKTIRLNKFTPIAPSSQRFPAVHRAGTMAYARRPQDMNEYDAGMSRVSRQECVRQIFNATSGAALASTFAFNNTQAAYADDGQVAAEPVSRNRLGGKLEPFSAVDKGWRILRPSYWK